MAIKHLLSGVPGGVFKRLASWMYAENPSPDGKRPVVSGNNSVGIGDDVEVNAGGCLVAGTRLRATGKVGDSTIHGIDITLTSGAYAYATLPGGTFISEWTEGGDSQAYWGDDRDGFTTVVATGSASGPTEEIAAGERVPGDRYAPTGGTTVQIRLSHGRMRLEGEDHYVDPDAAFFARYLEEWYYPGRQTDGFLFNGAGRSTVSGGGNKVSAGLSRVDGIGNVVWGSRHFVTGATNDVGGVGCAVFGAANEVESVTAVAFGQGVHANGRLGGVYQAGGFFATPGDGQGCRHTMSQTRFDSTAWVSLEVDGGAWSRQIGPWNDNGLRLRDGTHRVSIAFVGASADGSERIVRDYSAVVGVSGGTATILSQTPVTHVSTGTIDARLATSGRYLQVQGRGVAGKGVRFLATVDLLEMAFDAPPIRFPANITESVHWPEWADRDATLCIDFAADRACWRADTNDGTVATFGTIAEMFTALGTQGGATRDHRGLAIGAGDTPAITDLSPAGGPAANGTIRIKYVTDSLPASGTRERIVEVAASDGTPAMRLEIDTDETEQVRGIAVDDGGTTQEVAVREIDAGRLYHNLLTWTASAAAFGGEDDTSIAETWTSSDIAEIRLGYGGDQAFAGRIRSIAYAPTDTRDTFGSTEPPYPRAYPFYV